MDQQLLQRTRYLLQTRFRKLQITPNGGFELTAQQVLQWLEGHPIFSSILEHLNQTQGEHHQEIQTLLNSNINAQNYYDRSVLNKYDNIEDDEFRGYTPTTIEEHASACLRVIKAAVKRPHVEFYRLLAVYITHENYDSRSEKDPHEALKDVVAHDLYEYLDEQLGSINAVNGLLFKYKQTVEWFQKARIQEIIQNGYGNREGERALAVHLQQYIFDQGIEFTVEPSSASGEVDLLLRDTSGQYTIIDAKLIEGKDSRSEIVGKIAKGFNQVARYCNDYNQIEGFLAVFINDELSVQLNIDQNYAFRFFKIGNHIIYYIDINIADRKSASKSGKAKQVLIEKDELSQYIEAN